MGKRVKSLQFRFSAFIFACLLLSSVMVGGLSIMYAKRVVDRGSAETMTLMCTSQVQRTDALLASIELSVQTLSVYVQNQMTDFTQFKKNEAYVQAYTKKLLDVAVNAAENTDGAVAVYLRYNPAFTSSTSGLFYSKTAQNKAFTMQTPTDLAAFSSTDGGRVGWYHIPLANQGPTWLDAYQNENSNMKVISYVIPLYVGEEVLGVVGMDIDFSVLQALVDETALYKTGYAFVFDKEGEIVSHRTLAEGTPLNTVNNGELGPLMPKLMKSSSEGDLIEYEFEGETKRMVFNSLLNGYKLVLTAPVAEIDAERNNLMLQITLAALGVAVVSLLLTIFFTRRLVRPLKELNEAAQKIAEGNMDVSITYKAEDEVGTLAESFRQTVCHLRQYISYINDQAYHDPLTGVKNKNAYQEATARLDKEMRKDGVAFAVIEFDMNNLKIINDKYGHDFGDTAILEAVRLICQVYKHSPVYRVGGDEFVVIVEGQELAKTDSLLEAYKAEVARYSGRHQDGPQFEMAYGMAVYNPEAEDNYHSVFKRADEAMYRKKQEMKEQQSQACN